MAFDLIKLQILQEAHHLISTSKSAETMCHSIDWACSRVLECSHSSYDTVVDVLNTIKDSVKLRGECAEMFDSEHEMIDVLDGYLWEYDLIAKPDRLKYLERLIEDEMSGTYFIRGRL